MKSIDLDYLTGFLQGTLSASGNNGSVLDTVTNASVNTLAGSADTWTLDALGNWVSSATGAGSGSSSAPTLTSTSRTENSQNETTGVGLSTVTYDNNGNVTTNSVGDTLTYDAWNRLVTSSNQTTVMRYDALGNWDYENYASGTNSYYRDTQGHAIEVYDAGVYSQFVYGLAYVNELVLRDRHTGAGSNYGVAGSGLNERLYADQDANYNTTSLVSPGGTVAERIVYDPYGTPTLLTSAWAAYPSSTIYWRILYQGEYWLYEANVYIMGARDYDYTLGAWDQKDPTGYPDGMNTYQAFGSNAIALVDPSGNAYNNPFDLGPSFDPARQPPSDLLTGNDNDLLDWLDHGAPFFLPSPQNLGWRWHSSPNPQNQTIIHPGQKPQPFWQQIIALYPKFIQTGSGSGTDANGLPFPDTSSGGTWARVPVSYLPYNLNPTSPNSHAPSIISGGGMNFYDPNPNDPSHWQIKVKPGGAGITFDIPGLPGRFEIDAPYNGKQINFHWDIFSLITPSPTIVDPGALDNGMPADGTLSGVQSSSDEASPCDEDSY